MTLAIDPSERARLRHFLVDRFDLRELEDLAFDLGVDYQLFSHETIQVLARELITYFERRDRLSCLINEVLRLRDDNDLVQLLAKLPPCTPLKKIQIIVSEDLLEVVSELVEGLATELGMAKDEVMLIRATWGSTGALGALLDSHKKPQPVIGEIWLQSKANIFLITDVLAHAAAAGEVAPFNDALSKLPPLEGITLDQNSIRMKDGDVIFSVEALDRNGRPVTIWVRTRASPEAAERLLEDRLLEARDNIQSKEEPSEEAEAETSPSVLTPVSSEAVAKFSASEAEIKSTSLG